MDPLRTVHRRNVQIAGLKRYGLDQRQAGELQLVQFDQGDKGDLYMPHAPHAVVVLWPRKSGHSNKGFCSVTPNVVKWLPAFLHVHFFHRI